MADSPASGVELAQQSRDSHAIERVPTGVTAFVGRTLKGPVSQPLAVRSFAEFQQHFGGLWQPSTLSYAVEQFFENGGREARIVRVVNGARPPTITLPAGSGALRLDGAQSRLARVPARLGRLRRSDRRRARALQPRGAARAHRRFGAGGRPGDLPARCRWPPARDVSSATCCCSRAWCACSSRPRQRARIAPPAAPAAWRSATHSPIRTATTARRSPTTTSSARRAAAPGCSRSARRALQPAVHPAAHARPRPGLVDAAGGGALLPRAARAAAGRPAGDLDLGARGARCPAQLAVPQRQRRHVLPARAGVRSAARPGRDLRLLRRGGRHDRALR